MTKRLSEANEADFKELRQNLGMINSCDSSVEAAEKFVKAIYDHFSDSLVLLRLFITVRYDQLPEEDQRFVDGRGRDTNTSRLIHGTTPIFTLLASRGGRPEWNDRRLSQHFRCIPLSSTSFVSSLSMLSRQFESVGLDLGLIDTWQAEVAARGRADSYRGMLYIGDAGNDRDSQGRMIVPKQDFVAGYGVKTALGFGSGYSQHPTLVTLFAFTNETVEHSVAEPLAALLDHYIEITEGLVGAGIVFGKT